MSKVIGFRVSEEQQLVLERMAERLKRRTSDAVRLVALEVAITLENLDDENGNPPSGTGAVEATL